MFILSARSRLPRSALELLLHIASQLSDGIGAALTAVLHLLDDLAQLLLYLPLLLRRRRLDMSELVLGDEGHDIMNEYSHAFDLASYVEDVFVVYARD